MSEILTELENAVEEVEDQLLQNFVEFAKPHHPSPTAP
jgi:hypothetical protein